MSVSLDSGAPVRAGPARATPTALDGATAGAATIGLYAVMAFFMFGPLPQLFTGVDTTVTGVTAGKSWLLIFKTLMAAVWLPRLADGRKAQVAPLAATLPATWPVLLYAGWACASFAWATLPYVTARCAYELMLALLFAYTLCTRFSRADAFRILYLALTGIVVVSAALALAVPRMGVHQATDAMNRSHTGQWRGVFGHKNLLGQLAGVHFALTLTLASRLLRSRPLVVFLALLSALVLFKTGSSTALVIAAVGLGAWAFLQVQGGFRLVALLGVACAVLALAILNLDVVGVVAGALGKDPTLTGRTGVWQTVLGQMDGHWLAGHGYANFNVAGEFLSRVYGVSIPDAHSGYVEMLFTLGIAGVAAFGLLLLRAGVAVLAWARRSEPELLACGAILACWIVGALSEVSPFRSVNGLHLIGFTAVIMLLQAGAVARASSAAGR